MCGLPEQPSTRVNYFQPSRTYTGRIEFPNASRKSRAKLQRRIMKNRLFIEDRHVQVAGEVLELKSVKGHVARWREADSNTTSSLRVYAPGCSTFFGKLNFQCCVCFNLSKCTLNCQTFTFKNSYFSSMKNWLFFLTNKYFAERQFNALFIP